MGWSNKSTRTTITAEKAHSLSFSVRVEDRLHRNVIAAEDNCWLTVRPSEFELGFDDNDLTPGTDSVLGDGVRAAGVLAGTGEETRFDFEIQAAALNLDPELEYNYDITYVHEGYSMSVCAGTFEVAANVTNRGVDETFADIESVFEIVSTVHNRALLTVTSTIPMPKQGEPGNGAYLVTEAFSEVVGNTVVVPVSSITLPEGRYPQVGDVLFSSITRGVLATIQSISWIGTPSVTILTRQNYALQPLKALLDVVSKTTPSGGGANLETIDHVWSLPKSNVPLPAGYEYRQGDFVFTTTALLALQANRKLVISVIQSVGATDLSVQTKIVFPMFLDSSDIADLLATKADADVEVNGQPLTGDVALDLDDVPNGTTYARATAAQLGKLNALPTATELADALAGKSASSHTHNMDKVNGLNDALDAKVDSTTIDTIWTGTQAAYDAIATKNPRVLYIIKA